MCHKEYSFFFVRAFGLNWVLGIVYRELVFFLWSFVPWKQRFKSEIGWEKLQFLLLYILTRIFQNCHLPRPFPSRQCMLIYKVQQPKIPGADQCKVLGNCPNCLTTPPQFTLSPNSMLTSDLGKISGQGWGGGGIDRSSPRILRWVGAWQIYSCYNYSSNYKFVY